MSEKQYQLKVRSAGRKWVFEIPLAQADVDHKRAKVEIMGRHWRIVQTDWADRAFVLEPEE